MKAENKAKLKAASDAADTITDNVLLKVSQLPAPWSWVTLAVSHAIAFVLGAWFF